MQWVPGHDTLFPKLLGKLSPGGSLAIQIPDNADQPALRLMRETAADGPWASKLANVLRPARQAFSRLALQVLLPWFWRLLAGNALPQIQL